MKKHEGKITCRLSNGHLRISRNCFKFCREHNLTLTQTIIFAFMNAESDIVMRDECVYRRGLQAIIEFTGTTRDNIQKHLTRMIDAGTLYRKKQGWGRTSLYFIKGGPH